MAANIDTIMSSLRLAWSQSAYVGLMPASSLYFGRAQKPNELSGFPFAEVLIEATNSEVVTVVDAGNSLVTYELEIDVWTCQGMTGGSSTGRQVTDQGNIIRALEAVLNFIPPNTGWNYVLGFLHCLKETTKMNKDEELYRADVVVSRNRWKLLVSE